MKEQALCMLANIADGDSSKKLIVDNEDMLKKLKSYMLHNNTSLQEHNRFKSVLGIVYFYLWSGLLARDNSLSTKLDCISLNGFVA